MSERSIDLKADLEQGEEDLKPKNFSLTKKPLSGYNVHWYCYCYKNKNQKSLITMSVFVLQEDGQTCGSGFLDV